MTAVAATLPGWGPPPRPQRPRARLAAVLAAALALHAVLIGIPLTPNDPGTPRRPALDVEFARPAPLPTRRPETSPVPVPRAAPPLEALPQARPDPSERAPTGTVVAPRAPLPGAAAPAAPRPVDETSAPPRPELSTAVILERVRERDWTAPLLPADAPQADARPGTAWPRSWQRPILPREANLFDDAVLPTQTEILDRWRAADGAHEVVVRTPTGHTLCGRAAAYNPLEPLVEPIMMFRPCAGGGRRAFKPGVVRDDR